MIMLILLTCSSMIMADDEVTVEIPSYSETNVVGNKTTTLSEDVGNYFVWSIPENLQITDSNNMITVQVTQAHLNQFRTLTISISGLEDDNKLQLKNGDIGGSKITFKKEETELTKDNPEILSVTSNAFNTGTNSNIPHADIALVIDRNPFQFTNTYTGQITFEAKITS